MTPAPTTPSFNSLEKKVRTILKAVQTQGESAVRKYAFQFDGFSDSHFEVSTARIQKAQENLDPSLVSLIQQAENQIENFARAQKESLHEFELNIKGIELGQKLIPLDSVGCYIPGGSYPLLSTALMTIIPARVAGVTDIIVCSPRISDTMIGICAYLGATRIYNLGGVQAIGAMAYGIGGIPQVAKIVGPGNQYVTLAKKYVFGEVGIDMIAGPSEILIIADQTADPRFIAADLLAQAEHDPLALPILLSLSQDLIEQVRIELDRQLSSLPTRQIAKQALDNCQLIYCSNSTEILQKANEIAPEHLELIVADPTIYVPHLRNFGSLFIGSYSAEVFGDYCSGPNHVLPTARAARYRGGLSVHDFLKIVTYQKGSSQGIASLIPIASKLAEIEGLFGHQKAALIRQDSVSYKR